MIALRQAAQQALEALKDCVKALDALHAPGDSIYTRASDSADGAEIAVRAALAHQEQEQEPVAWVSVTQAMPKSGVKVLACYRNKLGKLRRIRAHWIAAKTVEASSEDWDQCSEYDEATDTYYVTEGWYECIDNWGDYSAVAVSEGDVTHWMALPEAPTVDSDAL
jgi:hypothetical protein